MIRVTLSRAAPGCARRCQGCQRGRPDARRRSPRGLRLLDRRASDAPKRRANPAHGYALVSISDGPTLRAAVGSVLCFGLIAMLSLGIATAIRDTAVSIGAVLGLLYLPTLLIQAVSDPLRRHLEQIAPMTAGLPIQGTTNLQSLPITPWAGLGVLAAWAAASLLIGGVLLRLRDA